MAESGLRVGSFAGAPIYLDATVLILAGYLVYSGVSQNGMEALPYALATAAALFIAILLHEFGHALTARAFGVPSREIVLTFFGGYVSFAGAPKARWHEIAIAAAGPGANLATWALLAFVIAPNVPAIAAPDTHPYYFLEELARISVLLGAFNLLPGFPLDGGTMLRAFASYFTTPMRARWVAAWSGMLIALGLCVWALTSRQYWTAGIGVMLVLQANREIAMTRRALGAAT